MLTVSGTSRRRFVTGTATVGLLGTLGLSLTVSGSEAAAAITDKVGAVVEAQAVLPSAPAAPATPATPAAPQVAGAHAAAAPSRAGAPTAKKKVTVVRNGTTTVYEGAEADAYIAANPMPVPPIPPLRMAYLRFPNGKPMAFDFAGGRDGKAWRNLGPTVIRMPCPGESEAPLVEQDRKGGRERLIICTNRMEAMEKNAQRMALQSGSIELHARSQARAGLGVARAAIERDRALSVEQRAEALAGIAQAEAELAGGGK